MSKERPVNLAHSIRQRLVNISRDRHEDPNLVFIRYALERFLYRLSCSKSANKFILKGAMLFAAWTNETHRPTRDLDLLGYGSDSEQSLTEAFRQIMKIQVEPDGLEFNPESITFAEIREGLEYPGKRLKFSANLGNIQLNLQIDIGFGDVVTPEAEVIDYPTLLDLPAPHIKAYPCESVVAEKLQALVAFDIAISRMKDFYDLWIISKQFSFDGEVLAKAIQATFKRRKTALPDIVPTALTDEFADDRDKVNQWKAFLNRTGLQKVTVNLSQVVRELREFITPVLSSLCKKGNFKKSWIKGGPWS